MKHIITLDLIEQENTSSKYEYNCSCGEFTIPLNYYLSDDVRFMILTHVLKAEGILDLSAIMS